jgi:hypothetical protein
MQPPNVFMMMMMMMTMTTTTTTTQNVRSNQIQGVMKFHFNLGIFGASTSKCHFKLNVGMAQFLFIYMVVDMYFVHECSYDKLLLKNH